MSPPRITQAFVVGSIATAAGVAPQVSAVLTRRDHWGTVKARWGVGRMDYRVDPGLYALGTPGDPSPVFVTANYKMSFDRLRENLAARDAWLLVLDTDGINVWCAAGKGTFGTEELVRRIAASGLGEVVSHREVILPQLSGPGIAAHEVRKRSGFVVRYGPIRSEDLPAYLDGGKEATPAMRRKSFTLRERLALVPIELVAAVKVFAIVMLAFFFAGGLGGPGGFWANAMHEGLYAVAALLCALLAGAVATPVLLPVLPGRAFSLKGGIAGGIAAAVLVLAHRPDLTHWPDRLETAAWLLLVPAVAAYLGMNFTGASTYTSLSGVKKEMRFALPAEIGAGLAGVALWLAARWMA